MPPSCPDCGRDTSSTSDAFCPWCGAELAPAPTSASASGPAPDDAIDPKVLAALLGYRAAPPTPARVLSRMLGQYAVLVVLGAVGIWLLLQGGADAAAWALGGLVSGAILRDLGWIQRMCRTWPTQAAIIDWRRVEELRERLRRG